MGCYLHSIITGNKLFLLKFPGTFLEKVFSRKMLMDIQNVLQCFREIIHKDVHEHRRQKYRQLVEN